MQINQPSPDAAESAMLVMLSRDAEYTGQIHFHGYTIECDRLSHQRLVQIKRAGQLLSKQNAWINQ